ncbi:uncharacterized protein MYCFIDRAFT_176421 [Pseudocercospora fijiensis CIRAD86]|uniref:Uncharacterized protein n=1 Tax=Pseudocercospora fijiensis (strain CIRAD86) TaxID=383855 RepID=M3AUE1_PSEFD|nr:uncharacterized protein MYCFIDRAFT_176421 [Pseudocercospora fijiensis CIRAD86]EME81102.1 hypothetical protein MYCFIDRAFT_176421 [Pseudocercospora fijiensis CIRAD86]
MRSRRGNVFGGRVCPSHQFSFSFLKSGEPPTVKCCGPRARSKSSSAEVIHVRKFSAWRYLKKAGVGLLFDECPYTLY